MLDSILLTDQSGWLWIMLVQHIHLSLFLYTIHLVTNPNLNFFSLVFGFASLVSS